MARSPRPGPCADPRAAELAVAYATRTLRNHPFVDGTKRGAFLLAYVFLARTRFNRIAPEAQATRAVLDPASGSIAEEALERWLADHLKPRDRGAAARAQNL